MDSFLKISHSENVFVKSIISILQDMPYQEV